MTRRRLWVSVLAIIGVAVVVLGLNLGLGNTPALGLDLRGGLSVVLAPQESATGDDLIVIRDLIRDELERRGIAEPDVRVEGPNIIVDLPGVRDQRDALDAVDVAGIVTLRPVFQCFAGPPPGETTTTTPGGTAPGTTTPGTAPGTTTQGTTAGTAASAPETTTAATSGTPTTAAAGPSGFARPERNAPPTTDPAPPATNPAPASTAPAAPPSTAPGASPTTVGGATTTTTPGATTTTAPAAPPPDTEVLPVVSGGQCLVGPSGGTGEVFGRGSARVDLSPQQGWIVVTSLTDSGRDQWNALASQCFNGAQTCPSRQLAIVLDDVIQSAPTVEAPSFPDVVSISGLEGEGEARALSRVLNRGAFPVSVEAQTVQTVSPTLGEDSLRAGVIAGMVGVVLVLLLLLVFYRRLTLLILAGMVVWGMLIFSVSTIVSQTTNYALTLAGVTGIIISVGVTVDSYVVYFERIKDEVRHGRTIKNSAQRAFKASWRTILAADVVSILAAAVLFILSVGSVRGFALYLGVTTVCDLIVFFCFTRPAVILLAGTGRLDRRDTFGLGVTHK